jgi:hypothetical protein
MNMLNAVNDVKCALNDNINVDKANCSSGMLHKTCSQKQYSTVRTPSSAKVPTTPTKGGNKLEAALSHLIGRQQQQKEQPTIVKPGSNG